MFLISLAVTTYDFRKLKYPHILAAAFLTYLCLFNTYCKFFYKKKKLCITRGSEVILENIIPMLLIYEDTNVIDIRSVGQNLGSQYYIQNLNNSDSQNRKTVELQKTELGPETAEYS